jgi:hypothetical protein
MPNAGASIFSPMILIFGLRLLVQLLYHLAIGSHHLDLSATALREYRGDCRDHRWEGLCRRTCARRWESWPPHSKRRLAARQALPWCWWARIRRARSMSAQQAQGRRREAGMASLSTACPPSTPEAELLALVEQAQHAIAAVDGHPGPPAAARRAGRAAA